MPIQKFGTEMPARPITFAVQSHTVSRLTAEITPAGMPISSAKQNPITEICNVTGNFCAIMCATGWPIRQL